MFLTSFLGGLCAGDGGPHLEKLIYPPVVSILEPL